MGLRLILGGAKKGKDALMQRVRRAEEEGVGDVLLIVPAQYTLQAEREALGEGSFRLQVLSPARLFMRIFEGAGWPSGVRIDDQGRVMLIQMAAREHADSLQWYRAAAKRKGFAQKALSQISGFKQAGLSPEELEQRAQSLPEGRIRGKLMDLSRLYAAYEQAIAGRFLDGEDEVRHAVERIGRSATFAQSEVFFFGFDHLSRPLCELVCALCRASLGVTVGLTMGRMDADRDADMYVPLERTQARILAMAHEQHIPADTFWADEMDSPEDAEGEDDIRHIEGELFSIPSRPYNGKISHVQLAALRSPREEAEFAASLARQLAMERNLRWREICVMAQTLDEAYESALRRAFAQADVPLFLPSSRPADRHAAARCLLYALRIVSQNWQVDDVLIYLRTGFSGLMGEDVDRLINHIIRRGLRGNALKKPLKFLPEKDEDLESCREAVAKPLLLLEACARASGTTRELLTAIFSFVDGLDMCGQLERGAEALAALGYREWAMEGAQVYARMLGAMDQMADLLGDARLGVRDVLSMLEEALSSQQIKPLPQSGDAVQCGSMDHMKCQDVKALLVIGLSDSAAPKASGLLSEEELRAVDGSEWTIALSPADAQRMARLTLKSALSFTSGYALFSYPMSGDKGNALKPNALVAQLRRILPGLRERGGQMAQSDRSLRHMCLNAPKSAAARLFAMLDETPNDPYLIALRDALGGGLPAEPVERDVQQLSAELAHSLFGQIGEVSVSRLERFEECPYQHFARYALRPEPFAPFELTPGDAGDFFHAAMEQFLREHEGEMSRMSQAESMASMDEITAPMMEALFRDALGEGSVARQQGEDLRKVARRAAAMLAHHLNGSAFRPAALEIHFGHEEPRILLSGGAALGGRIDRVDAFEDETGQTHVRVIDYKTGGKALHLGQLYYGLQMQLMVYLAAAVRRYGAEPAGVLYFPIADKPVDTDSLDPLQVEKERLQKLKLKGLVTSDERIYAAMSPDPKAVLPTHKDSRMDAENIGHLMRHSLRMAEDAHRAILGGDIRKYPVQLPERTACDHCDYAAVCQRSAQMPMRKIEDLDAAEALRRMQEEAAGIP